MAFQCTLETCLVSKYGYVRYRPSVAGNVLFLAILTIIAIAQLYYGIKYRTRSFCILMLLGVASEVLGYIARVLLNGNPFMRVYFLWYLICLTLGPVFMAAAIYLCLGRIVVVYGQEISRIRPRSYTIFFLGCDLLSLVVQAVGGGISASVSLQNKYTIHVGEKIQVAGLSLQTASLFAFSCCCLDFLYRVNRRTRFLNPQFADLYNGWHYKWFLYSLGLATTFLFIRTLFRSVELSDGFTGEMANSEVKFMVLDGTMVIVACIILTLFHPGVAFEGKWAETRFSFVKEAVEVDPEHVEDDSSQEKNATSSNDHSTIDLIIVVLK